MFPPVNIILSSISIHTLRMEGDTGVIRQTISNIISIHTLRMEGDPTTSSRTLTGHRFQSTPSAWRVTKKLGVSKDELIISIHTLRMEGDWQPCWSGGNPAGISIHTLRMEGDRQEF